MPVFLPVMSASVITWVNTRFEAFLGPTANWALDRLRSVAPTEYAHVVRCIAELEYDPYPPASRRAPLVIPGRVMYSDAYRCGDWRVAFHVEDDAFVIVDDVGRWPPRPF